MGIEEIVGLVLIFLVVVIPVLGFTARFALKPIVESILELRGALLQEGPLGRGSARILELEEELDDLHRTVRRLQGAREWERALKEGEDPGTKEEDGEASSGKQVRTRGKDGSGGRAG